MTRASSLYLFLCCVGAPPISEAVKRDRLSTVD